MGISISKVLNLQDYDDPKPVGEDSLYHKELKKVQEEMTGWDRVKAIFETDEFGEISPQLSRCKDATMISMFVGAALGGMGRSRIAMENFLRSNAHEMYETPQFGQKAMQDRIMVGFFDGAFRIGWRLSLFTFMYMLGSSCIAAYRGKAGVLDQVGGAAAAGFLYKFRDGPKAQVSGMLVAGIMGLGAGTLTWLASRAVGASMDDLVLFQYRNIERRNQLIYEIQKAGRHERSDELTAFHETFIADDDLAMSKIKKTPIGQLTEAVKKKEVDPEDVMDVDVLTPVAVANALKASKSQTEENKEGISPSASAKSNNNNPSVSSDEEDKKAVLEKK